MISILHKLNKIILYILFLFYNVSVHPVISNELVNACLYPVAWDAYNLDTSSYEKKKEYFVNQALIKLNQLKKYFGSIELTNEQLLLLQQSFFESISICKTNRFFESYEVLLSPYVNLERLKFNMNSELISFNLGTKGQKKGLEGRLNFINFLNEEYKTQSPLFKKIELIVKKIADIENKKKEIKNKLDEEYISYLKKLQPNKISSSYKDILLSPFMLNYLSILFMYEVFRKNNLHYHDKVENICNSCNKGKIINGLYSEHAKFAYSKQYMSHATSLINNSWIKFVESSNNEANFNIQYPWEYVLKDWIINIPLKTFSIISGYDVINTFHDIWKNGKKYDSIVNHPIATKTISYLFGIATTLGGIILFAKPFVKNRYYAHKLYQLYKLEAQKIKLTKELFSLISSLYKKGQKRNSDINNDIATHREHRYLMEMLSNYDIQKNIDYLASFESITKSLYVQTSFSMHFDYYYNYIATSPILHIFDQFVSSVELGIAKVKLLEQSKEVCIPKIHLKSENPLINIKNMHLPIIRGVVRNSIMLDENNKVVCLGSPIAAGKTVFLSAFYGIFIFAYTGIVPASYCEFSYFNTLIAKIKESYITGEGESKGSTEVKDMYNLKKAVENNKGLKLCIIDEIYSGLNPEDGYDFALEDIIFFLKRNEKDTIFIVTTHIPELSNQIISLIKQGNPIRYFYFKIDYLPNGTFKPTYLLLEDLNGDDAQNWYFKNKELRKKYIRSKMLPKL